MNLFCFLVEMLFHPRNSIPSHCAVFFLFPLHIFLSSLDVTHSKTWNFQILYDHRNSAFPQQEYPFSKAQSRQLLLQAESHSLCWDWGSFKATLLSRSAFHHVVIHSSCTLGLFGCLWSEKEQQSQLWNICCDKQTSGQMCAELAASERGAAVPGGAPLGTQALCWVPQPWARPLECQSNPYFSSESSAVAFWPEVTLCYLAFFPLKERNDAGEIFGFNGVKLLILPSNWHLSISSDLYWTIAFPPLLAFLITSASPSGEIPLLPMGKIQCIDQDKKIKRNNKKENYCRAKWAPFFGTTS